MLNSKACFFYTTSILSCLFLKNNKKYNANQLNLPSFRNVLEVKSAIKGRIRFYVPLIKENTILTEQILHQLKGITVIKDVSINAVTGSILIIYDPEKITADIIEGAVIKLLGLDTHINKEDKCLIERELRNILSVANQAILEKTDGFIDAKYILVIWLVLVSILKLATNPNVPLNPFSMLWWSSNIALRGK